MLQLSRATTAVAELQSGAELHVRGEHELMEEPELESSEVWPFCLEHCKSGARTSFQQLCGTPAHCRGGIKVRVNELRRRGGHSADPRKPLFQEDQEAADIVVTEARCAGGDEGLDAAAGSAPAEEAGMDTDAPKGGDTLGGGALVIKAAGALDSRWAALFWIGGHFLLT